MSRRTQREKNYWSKRRERFESPSQARSRAKGLRLREHVSHVRVQHGEEAVFVTYSVARWYEDELAKAGITL